MNLNAVSGKTTGTATGRQAMRSATHNVLYTVANSEALEISKAPTPLWFFAAAGVDLVLLSLCAFYFLHRHRNMKRWMTEQASRIANGT